MSEEAFTSTTDEKVVSELGLSLVYDHSINYAFQQNAIPVVKELVFKNDDQVRKNLTIRITTEPAFASTTEVRLQSIDAVGEFRVAPLDLKLSHDYLAHLNERVNGWLNIEVLEEDKSIHTSSYPISLLARNEWCGLVSLPEILAAFVLPNDPAIMGVLDKASDLLKKHTGRTGFNGYQDKNRKMAWEQIAAIYRAISDLGIRYINPPASFENTGQKVRFPNEIVSQRFGTCLDLALLFAACCEQVGLRPLVLMHEGHAYAGCWLEERMLPESAGDDLQHIRKLATDELLTVFETTIVTGESSSTLDQAELLAQPYLNTEKVFKLALDIQRSRVARIRPLPIPGEIVRPAADRNSPWFPKPVEGLGTRVISEGLQPNSNGTVRPVDRIDQWKSRLLDLTLMNRLLNFRETKSTIKLLSATPEHLEDELAAEKIINLRPKPRVLDVNDPRNATTFTEQQRTDLFNEHIKDELQHGRLHTDLPEAEHAKRLTQLYRAAKNAIEENGSNTLYAAVGFLEWREAEHSDRVHRAPILLVPVELQRKSVLEGFALKRLDEEPRINVTLLEMLRQNFRKEITGVDPLPEDESGVDVGKVFQIFRDAVRDLPGWEVKTEVWLGLFSFTKFLLWKDLADRLDALTQNRIVSHLINDAGTPYPNPSEDIRPERLDDDFHPSEIFCPRSADSSQLAAVMAAAAGHDFVLEGPPGTGKSQTITNIIAHCLANGKRVLFVAEKRAALDVVHRRLKEDGLEPFCLELHSNKAGKADVLAQFDRTLKLADGEQSMDWEMRTDELERLRSSLNLYSRILHNRYACGLSAYQCFDHLLPRKYEPIVSLKWVNITETPYPLLEQARNVARTLQERSKPLQPLANHCLQPLACEEWTPTWAERMPELITDVIKAASHASLKAKELYDRLGLKHPILSLHGRVELSKLIECLLAPEPVGPGFATSSWATLKSDLRSLISSTDHRSQLRTTLFDWHADRTSVGPKLKCESWENSVFARHIETAQQLRSTIQTAIPSVRGVKQWLGLSGTDSTVHELQVLLSFSESLLSPLPVGKEFAMEAWSNISIELNQWIQLVEERGQIRSELQAFAEPQLLSLDLDRLNNQWQKAEKAWAIPKLVNGRLIRSKLKKAHLDKKLPQKEEVSAILAKAIRLRSINEALTKSTPRASSLLASIWGDGEPDIDRLRRVREWGKALHLQLSKLTAGSDHRLVTLRGKLAALFNVGPASYAQGTEIGDRLFRFKEVISTYLGQFMDFAKGTDLHVNRLEEHPDHLDAVLKDVSVFLEFVPRLRQINEELEQASSTAASQLGVLWNKGEPSLADLERVLAWGERLHGCMVNSAGDDIVQLGQLRNVLASLFTEGPTSYSQNTPFGERLVDCQKAWMVYSDKFTILCHELRLRKEVVDKVPDHLASVIAMLERIASEWPKIRLWCSWQKTRREAIDLGMGPVVEHIESSGSNEDVQELFERSFRRALLFAIIEQHEVLSNFFGREHAERIDRFRLLDEQIAKLTRQIIASRLATKVPRENAMGDIPKAEIGLLRKEIGKRRRHIPVRQLLGKIPTLLPRLKPCVLMSPMSVAQYLEPTHEAFDVVIFDEASQIPVWDAIGAIARGKQLIVVGDPKQLPPTNFFNTSTDDDDELTPEEHKDLESILDELMTNGMRHKRLQWHYRSRHESLITFSNAQYYENDLLTFPSPEIGLGGVKFKYMPKAMYDKGKSRTNKVEAAALVKELVRRLRKTDGPPCSYGVVTFSSAQQQLVENLLDEERRKDPSLEIHFGDDAPVESEPVFVKNLENVQGDQRDVILFSICYGPDQAGKISMSFGPLNLEGGERRLNVAITRAKEEMIIFSSLKGNQIDLTRTRARGVRDLKYFLEFAERGPKALSSVTSVTGDAEPDSEFEAMVAKKIREAGYEVHHQVGCSGYRIDLAVVDPAASGRYILGIECDGATYHRAATARDRDKLRQSILEGLGWQIHRIWSTDWWHSADEQMELLLAKLPVPAANETD